MERRHQIAALAVLAVASALSSSVLGACPNTDCLDITDTTSTAFLDKCSCTAITKGTAASQTGGYSQCVRCASFLTTSTATAALTLGGPSCPSKTVDKPLYRLCLQYFKNLPNSYSAISDLLWGKYDPAKALEALKCSYALVADNKASLTWACHNCYLRSDTFACNQLPPPPPAPLTGYIKVTVASEPANVFYMSNAFVRPSGFRYYGAATDASNRLRVQFSSEASATAPTDITIINPSTEGIVGSNLLGAVATINNAGTFGSPTAEEKLRQTSDLSNAKNALWLATVGTSTGANGRAVLTTENSVSKGFFGGLPALAAESTIWYLDRATNAIQLAWINPDGTKVPLTLFAVEQTVSITQYVLFLTGDYSAYCAAYSDNPDFTCANALYKGVVTLTFEPDTSSGK